MLLTMIAIIQRDQIVERISAELATGLRVMDL
jgi:hypothetical protein